MSTIQLVKPGRFLLIAGEDGQQWCDAARNVSLELGVPVDAVMIGHAKGDYLDPRLMWQRHRGVTASGAVLVRPDRFVAWRSMDAVADHESALRGALTTVLHRV